jgi:hypothetical protein
MEALFITLSKKRWQILSMGENQADLELTPIANGTGTATVCGDPSTLMCVFGSLCFTNAGMEDSPIYVSASILPDQHLMHFIFHGLPLKCRQ